ncbi:hypothetical protein ACP4OV_024957 [Aristida adscensionis]
MAGSITIDDSVASTTGLGDEDRSVSGDSLSEWRSYEQFDNGSPSTSPPFWDTDGEDDDPGPRPSDLFGRHTWRIENFSKEKKREMKSEPFEAGGYKWYILVYPQGCDVPNHLSLFLCVANHDKLLPGWSHFAQFTIAVGNVDPKKVKYSDTLHRFWKKEHDWGWKKFMELSKVQDGFLVDDVLEIIAQVQVIREKVDRPFRCLDRPYRRELLRVYMTNIEQIYHRFVQERRRKLVRLIDDKMNWSSFRAFWLAIDPTTRTRMSREKSDVIMKILVKHFFVEKEVTSTLVMDALYTGLKALEYHSKGKKGTVKDVEGLPAPMIHVDMDMFVLAGDFIALLERAALEPLSCQPLSPKDDKCSQSRAKDGGSGEVNKVSIEREERRLTELGQKILETFVLSHIFSGVDVAYKEAVALKRQEELIREEELLESEMKGKRVSGTEKDKRSKKKQAKQKKNNRKVKDKGREEKSDSVFSEGVRDESTNHDSEDSKKAGQLASKVDNSEEGASDVSDNIDGSSESKQNSTVEIETLISSVSATVSSIRGKINNLLDSTSHITPNRVKSRRSRGISIMYTDESDLPSSSSSSSDRTIYPSRDQETALLTLKDRLRKLGQRLHEWCGPLCPRCIGVADVAHLSTLGSLGAITEDARFLKPLILPALVPCLVLINEFCEYTVARCKEIEGRELLKAHLEKKAAAEAVAGSSSSDSSEKTRVRKGPEKSSAAVSNANNNAPPPKAAPVATSDVTNGPVPATETSTISTKSVPIATPTASKPEPVLGKDHVSNSTQQVDRANITPSRALPVDKAIPIPPKSPAPQADPVSKSTPAPPKSSTSQLDKVAKAIPASPKSPAPQADKVSLQNSLSRQSPSKSVSKAREDTVPERVPVTSAPRTPTPTSRPSSAPLFQATRGTVPPTHTAQVSPLIPRSMTVSGRPNEEPSPSTPGNVTQAYRNAILGKSGPDTTLASLEKSTSPGNVTHAYRNAILGKSDPDTTLASLEQSTSVGQNITVSQPLSAYSSATYAMMPTGTRSDHSQGNQGVMFGLSKPGALDNWQPWKGNSDVNRHMWMDDTPNQQVTNSDVRVHPWRDTAYQQASSSRTEEQGRFGGLQPRQFQRQIPPRSVMHQQQVPVVEEFPHLDIINDLLDEEQSSENMAASPLHEYHTFDLSYSSRGNMADSEIASVSSSGRYNLTDHYYDEGYRGSYDTHNALHRLRERQLSTLDVYSNGRLESTASKPWLYSHPNPAVNLGINSSSFSHQMDYTNLTNGRVNGEYPEYLYRRANGQW